MPARSLHEADDECAGAVAVGAPRSKPRPLRAKYLTNGGLAERIEVAGRFDRLVREKGLSNGQLARWMLTDEKHVRELRLGVSPLQVERVRRLPPDLCNAVLAVMGKP